MFRTRAFLTGLVVMGCALTTAADTIYVNGDCGDDAWTGLSPDCVAPDGPKATIQAGIDAAVDGDTVEIACGTYTGPDNKNLDFGGRAITVRSASGDPDTCIIDCQGSEEDPHRGFYFHSGEGADSVVDGLTITNGYIVYDSHTGGGGGVYCRDSSPTLTNCTMYGNWAGRGGAVFCEYSSPTLTNCTIVQNAVALYVSGTGGGICCRFSSPILTDCTINQNSAGRGGGIACDNSRATLINCTIDENTAGRGGGVFCISNRPLLVGCKITRNTARSRGGGIYCYFGSPVLTNCLITLNAARDYGGAIDTSGGYGHATLTGCTVTRNVAGYDGGGLYCGDSLADSTLSNCIVWSNAPQAIYVDGSDVLASYSDIEGGWEGVGNIAADPLVTPDGHLTAESPCLNGGDPGGDYADQTDIDGEPRVIGARVDMGFDEWLDTDADGLPDWWEQHHFGDALSGDPLGDEDADGRANLEEYGSGRNPFRAPREYHVSLTGDDDWDGLCEQWDGGTCGPKATIQAAIDTSDPIEGDTVTIADGTYTGYGNRDIDFGGKAITVRSASGDPAACVIDCEGSQEYPRRGFYFHRIEKPDSVVEGLTITNGYAADDSVGSYYGGGIYCEVYSSPTLINCAITANMAIGTYHGRGGGIYCWLHGSPTLISCVIAHNVALTGGGGVYCEESGAPTMTGCAILENWTIDEHGGGGGVYSSSSSLLLSNCTIMGNAAGSAGAGGGLRCWRGDVNLIGCRIAHNSASSGGGVYWSGTCDVTLVNCVIVMNAAERRGAGIFCGSDSSATLVNCRVTQNAAGENGGGVACLYSNGVMLANCTITRNIAGGGGGVYCREATVRLTNSIVWANGAQALYVNDGDLDIGYSAVEGGWPGEGNIEADPLITPDGHLTVDSPCLNAGDPEGDYADQIDIDGEPRVVGGRVDVGSDEWLDTDEDGLPDWWEELHFGDPLAADPQGNPDGDGRTNLEEYAGGWDPFLPQKDLYVSPSGDDGWDGLCREWSGGTCGPKATIRAAIGACSSTEGDTVVIADGTYAGQGNRDLDFEGKIITVRSASGDPALCIIDCGGSENYPYRGFYFHSGEGPRQVLDGVTITNGYVTGASPGGAAGGGICCESSSPTLTNCVITQCTASGDDEEGGGGGVFCSFSNPMLTNCTITDNTSGGNYNHGGGIGCYSSSPTLIDCIIARNTSHYRGGGIYSYDSSPMFVNCAIRQNTSSGSGGGVHCFRGSPVFTNCTITLNALSSTHGAGGGFCCDRDCMPTLTNCTIAENTAGDGGGVYCGWDSSPMLTNCAILSNAALYDGGGVYCEDGTPALANCLIALNTADSDGGGVYCEGDAALANCLIALNTAGDDGGGLHCFFQGSPTLTNCTITQNTAGGCGAIMSAWQSSPVLANCVVWGNGPEAICQDDGNLSATYCDVQGGTGEPWFGIGCIDADPLFVDPDGSDSDPDTREDNDYRLGAGSPCIDAGDNDALPRDALDLDGDGDVDELLPIDLNGHNRRVDDLATIDTGNPGAVGPPVVDMGAYEYFLGGDMDCDGDIDFDDIDPFVLALGGPAGYEAAYPDCNWMNADCDNDGFVDFDDIDAFMALLGGGSQNVAQAPRL